MSIDEKPTSNYFVNAGIYVFDPKIFKYISGKIRYARTYSTYN